MSLTNTETRPVHFPANAAAFGFDAEVSKIFPDMAQRSIPNFYESHAAHATMLRPFVAKRKELHILDIGASRGAFFTSLATEFGKDWMDNQFLHALDNSPHMCEYLKADFPEARIRMEDITGNDFLKDKNTYDVVSAHYVLQFVPRAMQEAVLNSIFTKVRPGGVLIYGHKSAHYGTLGNAAHEQYLQYRMSNGYSREEIEAKTASLKGSMYATDHDVLLESARRNFSEVQETFRFMMFSTFMAVK